MEVGLDGGLRVVLAEHQSLFREAMRVALSAETDVAVVAEASDGVEALAEAERTRPQAMLVDVDLPRRSGIEVAAVVADRLSECRVIVLSGVEDQAVLIKAIEAGASGYLTKEVPLADLVAAIRTVAGGGTVIPPRMLGPLLARLLKRGRDRNEALRTIRRLTRREREVLALLASGGDNQTIADALVISPQTARTHIQNVLGKLGVHSRLEATAFVVRSGLLDELEAADEPDALSQVAWLAPVS